MRKVKPILDTHPYTFIGLEHLTGIRERTKRRKYRRKGKRVVPVSAFSFNVVACSRFDDAMESNSV